MNFRDAVDLDRFAEDYTTAWCSGNPARVAAFFTEDGVLTVNDASPCVGRAAIAESARASVRIISP
mgnify:CR=1 FL=1